MAVQHLTNSSVCAACVAFTEMLGFDSTPLRVDIQAAKRLLVHAGLEDLSGDEAKEDNTMEDAIGSYITLTSKSYFYFSYFIHFEVTLLHWVKIEVCLFKFFSTFCM